MATQVSSSAIVLELLDKDNYTYWSVQVKTYLQAQDLWDIIEATTEHPKPEDDEAAFKAWSRKNAMALHAIQISCQPDTFFWIMEITSAQIAWGTLAEKYTPDSDSGVIEYKKKKKKKVDSASVPRNLRAAKKNTKKKSKDGRETANIENNDYREYADLYKAVLKGKWEDAEEFLNHRPDAVGAKITYYGGTALHVAVNAGHVHIVKELVEKMSEQNLEIQDDENYTALALTAFRDDSKQMAEYMVRKNMNLVSIAKKKTQLPVVLAVIGSNVNLARYLYALTPLENFKAENGIGGTALISESIYTRNFDLALHLLRQCPYLTIPVEDRNSSPLLALASMPYAFPSGNKLVFWKQWIYNCIHIDQSAHVINETQVNIQQSDQVEVTNSGIHIDQSAHVINETRVNIQQSDQVKVTNSVLAPLVRLVSHLLKLFGIKQIYEMKSFHAQSKELLSLMCNEISNSSEDRRKIGGVYKAIFRAIKEGNFDVVFEVVRTNPDLILARGVKGRNIFYSAVQHRQEKIFSLIYRLDLKSGLTSERDKLGNTMLHMAGMLTASTKGSRIPGAALQMQRELQWFKEVENILHPINKYTKNGHNLTPQELFTRDHNGMLKDGEKWMKETATSCTVVSTLIVTIMFAAAFTVPGGNDQNTGFPMFLQQGKLFMIFIVSDALSLFSSSTSVLMFLGILTSRYEERDFLKSLPRKMIIGLSTLFFSIATMMIAFSTGLLLLLRQQSWMVIPVICLASVPVTLFVLMIFRLLVEMFIYTYGSGIFNKKMEPWI